MRKFISAALAAAMLISAVPAAAKDYRNGCTLAPLQYDETGVLPDSGYVLSGSFSDKPVVYINDGDETEVTEQADGTYLVTPLNELKYNSLYTFTLDGGEPVSWTFQTAEHFSVTNALPGDYAYNVPINSGIEITFSHEDFKLEDVKTNFSITPELDGKWEKHKNTAVFVPEKGMAKETTYTVTVDGNMSRSGEAMGDSYSFSFTTETSAFGAEPAFAVYDPIRYKEVATGDIPEIPLSLYSDKGSVNIVTEVYGVRVRDAVNVIANDGAVDELLTAGAAPVMQSARTLDSEPDEWSNPVVSLPDKLQPGFWLVKITVEDREVYTLLQSTDTAIDLFRDAEGYLLWVNSFDTGNPIGGAAVRPDGNVTGIKTDRDGLAYIPAGEDYSYLELETPDGRAAYYPMSDASAPQRDEYRSVVMTDRTLYRSDDIVHIWGAAFDFLSGEPLKGLRAELYTGYYYGGRDVPVLTAELTDGEASFEGEMELPNISSGAYYIRVMDGERVVTSTYFSVEDYVKPTYKLAVEPDKKAIFIGDEINYTVNTSFFDGTPVSDLDVNCSSSSYNFTTNTTEGKTDKDGNFSFSVRPDLIKDEYRGTTSSYAMGAYAVMPESGDISALSYVTVYFNDIRINAESSFRNGSTHITLHSDKITLDRLNDGTAKRYNDYIDSADAGRAVKADVYEITYDKVENGTSYDYISKKSYTVYNYVKKERNVKSYSLTTDESGDAECDFKPTGKDGAYYELRIKATDRAGRTYTDKAYLETSEKRRVWQDYYSSDSYYVSTDKEKYDLGETAEISITKGMEPAKDTILMIKDCNGMKDVRISRNGRFKTVFNELPGASVKFYAFNPTEGYKYVRETWLLYDRERSGLSFDITSDKESYMPGDECTLNIKASDTDGKPVKADINISVVDEALLALRDNDIDSLSELYSLSYSYIITYTQYTSHRGNRTALMKGGGSGGGAAAPMAESAKESKNSSVSVYDSAAEAGVAVRSDFKDTALFRTVTTDDGGSGSITFKLPDNITSWRAAVSGVTSDMKAGSAEYGISVSMPQFISYNMNNSFITGDSPVIGVNLYGGSLTGGEDVLFRAECGENTMEATGKAYERVNIPLGTLDAEGEQSVTVTAYIDGRAVDSVKTDFTVTDTYNKTTRTVYYDSVYDKIQADGDGNVRIVFTDKSRSALLGDICLMRGLVWDRLDMMIAQNISRRLLNEYYGMELQENDIDLKTYQSRDGGMKLFPYGESDIDATAKLTPLIADDVDRYALTGYLTEHKDNIKALYALACLREPVLNDLEKYAAADNMRAVDYLYIALAYCELGEYGRAEDIFNARIAPAAEDMSNAKRVVAGTDNDDIIEATALAALVSLYMQNGDAEKYYDYCMRNCTEDIVTDIERLMYITTAIKTLPKESGSVSVSLYGKQYDYEFSRGEGRSVTVPAAKLDEFKVISASESVRMMSVSDETMRLSEKENRHITMERTYSKRGGENTNTFSQNDIIAVTIKLDFGGQAEQGGYVITDYLPSGLRPISDNIRCSNNGWYMQYDGQKVSLYAYNGNNLDRDTVTYYARVVSPGKYTADNAVLQSGKSTDILAVTDRVEITIE